MKLFLMDHLNENDLLSEIDRIGADRRSFPYFAAKCETILLSAEDLDVRAANALKQEMLSRGGDIIVHRRTIDCGVNLTDALLIGTPGQFSRLLEKLAFMPYWGLDKFCLDLEKALRNIRRKTWDIALPGGRNLRLGETTRVMGIVNVTGDSFFKESRHIVPQEAVDIALRMLDEGADIVDIGGESTRPGAPCVSPDEETDRVRSVIAEIRRLRPQAVLSVDTRKSNVALEAVRAGADIVNDVSGLRFDPEMAQTIAGLQVPVVLMHSRKTPENMQDSPHYSHVVSEVWGELDRTLRTALHAGIAEESIILDPGLGFAKEASENLSLLKHLSALATLGRPLLVGHSRKSTIGRVLGLASPEERLEGTLALTALCAWRDVPVVRVHDVQANCRVVKMIEAVRSAR